MSFSGRRLLTAALLLLCVSCSKDNNSTSTTTPTCTVSAGNITASAFGPGGGTGSVPITAGSGCAWTATSSAAFLTISSGASGTGNGTVAFSVAPNPGAARSATLTIAGASSFTITQSAAAAPTSGALSAPAASSPVGGQTVNVPRPTLVVNNAAASGNVGTVTYRFEVSDQASFPNDAARTFTADGVAQGVQTTSWTLTRDLGNDVLWYWHARATDGVVTSAYSPTETFRTPTTCTYSIAPANVAINATDATLTIAVTTGSSCTWSAASNSPFITVVSGASGVGAASVVIQVAANDSTTERTGTVTIAGQTFTVTQAAP
jgi:Putative binding domain, N-terminal